MYGLVGDEGHGWRNPERSSLRDSLVRHGNQTLGPPRFNSGIAVELIDWNTLKR